MVASIVHDRHAMHQDRDDDQVYIEVKNTIPRLTKLTSQITQLLGLTYTHVLTRKDTLLDPEGVLP